MGKTTFTSTGEFPGFQPSTVSQSTWMKPGQTWKPIPPFTSAMLLMAVAESSFSSIISWWKNAAFVVVLKRGEKTTNPFVIRKMVGKPLKIMFRAVDCRTLSMWLLILWAYQPPGLLYTLPETNSKSPWKWMVGILVGAQPPPCCSFARHLVGKMVIHCSFAHH